MKRKLFFLMVLVLWALVSCEDKTVDYSDFVYGYMVDSFAETLEQGGVTADIVFFGDSRVAQGNWKEAFEDDIDLTVLNLGIGGDTTDRLLRRLVLIDVVKPKYCFLSIGGNDLGGGGKNIRETEATYEELLQELKSRGIVVYVMTNPGICLEHVSKENKARYSQWNKRMEDFNGIIKALAEKYGMTLLDMVPAFTKDGKPISEAYVEDGVHYSRAGLERWYEALRPTIQSL